MKVELPEFIIELSKQMNEQPSRCTAHPFWQVRTKRILPCPDQYSDVYEVFGEDGTVYISTDPIDDLYYYLFQYHEEFLQEWKKENHPDEQDCIDSVFNFFDIDIDGLPSVLEKVYVQEVEEVVSTHLTEVDALAFIKRKQHDYPELYTYVESAYWSPQLRQLQDWIMSLDNAPSIPQKIISDEIRETLASMSNSRLQEELESVIEEFSGLATGDAAKIIEILNKI